MISDIYTYENQTCKYADVSGSNSLIQGKNRDKYEKA